MRLLPRLIDRFIHRLAALLMHICHHHRAPPLSLTLLMPLVSIAATRGTGECLLPPSTAAAAMRVLVTAVMCLAMTAAVVGVVPPFARTLAVAPITFPLEVATASALEMVIILAAAAAVTLALVAVVDFLFPTTAMALPAVVTLVAAAAMPVAEVAVASKWFLSSGHATCVLTGSCPRLPSRASQLWICRVGFLIGTPGWMSLMRISVRLSSKRHAAAFHTIHCSSGCLMRSPAHLLTRKSAA